MASNSKKRRRVLGVSCILAALIIASSSFAWFTSKDEVTNRLTANADYGVSIVESFAPPANWLPGEQVNKDVYAVNTGTIDAFVKETVSGKLTYTYELKTEDFDPTKCVKLTKAEAATIDGAITEEAGGFLAWSIDANGDPCMAPGPINSARPEDVADDDNDPAVNTPRWTPPKTGAYIFRRSITDNSTDSTSSVSYKYAGYYAVVTPGASQDDPATVDYYKIVIGKDPFRAANESANTYPNSINFDVYATQANVTDENGTAVDIGANGVLNGNPKIWYVTENKETNKAVSFEYTDGTAGEADYLKVVYSTKTGDVTTKKADMDAAEIAYERAKDALELARAPKADKELEVANLLGAYNTAKSRYEQTKADYEYAKALAEASNELYAAAREREAINYEQTNRMATVKQAATDLKNLAADLEGTVSSDNCDFNRITKTWGSTNDTTANGDAISPASLISTNIRTYINNNGRANGDSILDNCKANLQAVDEKWADIRAYSQTIEEKLAALAAIANGDNFSQYSTPAAVDQLLADLVQACADLEQALDDYGTLYRHFQEKFDELHLTGMDLPDTSGVLADITTAKGLATSLKTQVNDATNDTGLTKKVNDYDDAYNAYNDYTNGDVAAADTNWKNAVKTYNNKVGAARGAYDAAIKTAQPLPNQWKENTNAPKLDANNYLTDNSANTLIGGLAANDDGANPKIAENSDYATYANATRTGTPPVATYAPVDEVVPTDATFKQIVTDIPSTAQADLALGTAPSDLTVAQLETLMTAAEGRYNTAKAALDAMDLTTQEAAVETAKATYEAAEREYNTANTGSTITLKVYLDPDVDRDAANSTWTLDADTDKTPEVAFYLNKILAGGATSDKLIDYVEFDKSVTATDYKNLTFDLNVGLDSAQITYDADQRTYTATAVNDNPTTFVLQAAVANNEDVTWTDRTTPTSTYTLGYNVINASDITNEPKTIGTTTYDYKVVVSGVTYYGDGNTDGAKFYKYNPAVAADPTAVPPVAAVDESFDTTPVTLTVTTE